jgi:hypothetical protein
MFEQSRNDAFGERDVGARRKRARLERFAQSVSR